jgi:hypothetical protein
MGSDFSDHTFSGNVDDPKEFKEWVVPRLWAAAEVLIEEEITLASLKEITDQESWLSHLPDTSHPHILPEIPRIRNANLDYPILLHPKGHIMDGYHRVAKALLEGKKTIKVLRFTEETLPKPDRVWWEEVSEGAATSGVRSTPISPLCF